MSMTQQQQSDYQAMVRGRKADQRALTNEREVSSKAYDLLIQGKAHAAQELLKDHLVSVGVAV